MGGCIAGGVGSSIAGGGRCICGNGTTWGGAAFCSCGTTSSTLVRLAVQTTIPRKQSHALRKLMLEIL
jgi:hypothetical protein